MGGRILADENQTARKGLAVIYDPHNLYQFLWYYCNQGINMKWDALCLPNGYKGEYMHAYCENAGIFDRIFKYDTDYSILPVVQKLVLFIKMFLFFLIGKKKEYCKRILNSYVNESDYDTFVVIADVGVVSGACIALGSEKRVIILEDGLSDYANRPFFIPWKKIRSVNAWQGFFLSIMGYCCPGWFRLRTNKHCIKYCSHPDKMRYRNYRELRLLYDNKGMDYNLFECIIKRVYCLLGEYDFSKVGAVLLTTPLDSYVSEYEKYMNRIEQYVKECGYETIVLKKHPREKAKYQFDNAITVIEVDNGIPFEAIVPFVRGKEVIVTSLSSSILCLNAYNIDCKIIFLNGLLEESLRTNSAFKPYSYAETERICNEYLGARYSIVCI